MSQTFLSTLRMKSCSRLGSGSRPQSDHTSGAGARAELGLSVPRLPSYNRQAEHRSIGPTSVASPSARRAGAHLGPSPLRPECRMSGQSRATELLITLSSGNRQALDELVPLVYERAAPDCPCEAAPR